MAGVSRIVGIDLGTTNSLVAVVESGIPLVLADADGQRLTPSVVHVPADSSPPVVGRNALRVRALHPESTLSSVKRFMGLRASELTPEETRLPYRVRPGKGGVAAFEVHEREWLPEEVSAEVLKKLRDDAAKALGEPVDRAVITVPAYFNDAQRAATKRAGELAGFQVERIVNEPTAAALAYGLDRLQEKSRVAVYDLGGGTFDLSILELNQGVFQVLATHGNTRLGGDDLDRRLASFLAEQVVAQLGQGEARAEAPGATALDSSVRARLREAAEEAKIRLSRVETTEVVLPFLWPGFSFSCSVTREQLEQMTRDLVEQTRSHCRRALADARLEPRDLDQVILVGGQTRMPLVRRLVAEWFQCRNAAEFGAPVRGTDARPVLNVSQNPDEAVALGAAIQAEILAGGYQNIVLLDVTPLSLGIETFGGLMNVIIPRNSTIPLKAGEVFTTAVDNQRSMLIHVLQGERERARDNWSLGRFELEFQAAPRGVPRVGVQFEIDANGILHVLARDTRTGRERRVEMRSAVDVEDAAVQRMVEESVEHAFDDLSSRRWIEARLRVGETVAATRKGLQEATGELPPDQVQRIQEALERVDRVLKTEDSASQTGDLTGLKEASAALDEATRPLAELLMDRAMLAMLEKRGLIR